MEEQLITARKKGVEFLTPLRPMCSAICPLAIAPTIAPTLDSEPNAENCSVRPFVQHSQAQRDAGLDRKPGRDRQIAGYLGDGELEVPNHGVLGGGGEAAGEAELDGPERDDERAEEGGDVGLAQDCHGGCPGGDAGLPRAHPVPAARVDGQQRLPQPAIVVAAALLTGAGAGSAPVAGATHAFARRLPLPSWRTEDTIDAKRNRRPVEMGKSGDSGLSCLKLGWEPTGQWPRGRSRHLWFSTNPNLHASANCLQILCSHS